MQIPTLKEQYAEAVKMAKKHGWIVSEESKWFRNGPAFEIKHELYETHLWRTKYNWQCADIIANHFCNHRPQKDLLEALKTECHMKVFPGSEFALGQRVTFKPYEIEFPATVMSIFEEKGEMIYKLQNTPKERFERPVVTNTSGRSIMESTFFEEHDEYGNKIS